MTSVNTNVAAITALRTLQQTNSQLDATQGRISTGLKIGEAKDNAAYWAISTTLKSDNKSLATVKDALGLGAATVDVAYQGLNKAKDVLDEIKAKLTAATQPGVDKNVIQSEIGELQKQLASIAGSSVFSGENWLSVDSSATDYDATKKIVASFSRDANNSVAIGTVDVAIGGVALYDSSTVKGKNGVLDGAVNLKDSTTGRDLDLGAANTDGNVSKVGIDTASANATNGTVSTAVVAGAGNVAGSAATVQAAQGTDAAPTHAVHATETAVFSSTGGTTVKGDMLKFDIKIDGGGPITVTVDTGAAKLNLATGLNGITSSMVRDAINGTAGLSGVASLDSNGYLVLTSNSMKTGATDSQIQLLNILQRQSNGTSALTTPTTLAGLTADSAAITGTAGTATTAAVTTSALNVFTSGGSFADGDVVTISYKLNGVTATKDVVFASKPTTQANLASGIAAAFGGAGAVSGLNVSVAGGSGSETLKFETATGAAKSFELSDITVRSSPATGSVIKNIDVVSGTGFVESKSASATTGDVAAAYTAGKFAPTDKLTFGLSVDGTKLNPVTVAAGASLSTLVDNLNADTTFSAKAIATIDANSKLVIHSKTTGAGSAISVNTVSFSNADGLPQAKTGTGFVNVATTATASTSAFTAPVTLDENDNIYFNVKVDDATAPKLVSIDKALVDKALKDVVGYVAGTISSASQFKMVVDAALNVANITNVDTAVGTGSDLNKLMFSTKSIGTDAKLAISDVAASAGADQISVSTLDISDAGLTAAGATSGENIAKLLKAYISVVNTAINKVTTAASNLGAVASRIDMQKSFVNTLMDTIDKGVGNLIDADMSEESTRLQALQTKQQLGVQALSIANQSSQNILSLFR